MSKISEALLTTEAQAAQVIIARLVDATGQQDTIEVGQEDLDALQAYVEEAIALNPTDNEAIASAVLIIKVRAEKSDNEKFKVFAQKIEELWAVYSDDELGSLEKITAMIGIIFQSKKRTLRKFNA